MSNFKSGDKIVLKGLPALLKTADPMPMLRPPNTLAVGDIGTIINFRPGGYYGVRFSKGNFLLEAKYFELQ